MALTEKILPNITGLPCGTVGVRLYYDSTITGMAFPLNVRFLDIGEFVESVDVDAGSIDIDNVDVVVAEDYTVHSEGFWYKFITENPDKNIEIMFTLFEDGVETFLFRGNIYGVNAQVAELYLDNLNTAPTQWVRGMKFKLVSSLNVLKDVAMADLGTEIDTHDVEASIEGGVTNYNWVTFKMVIASAIKLAWGVDYDTDLVVTDTNDIEVYDEAATAWVSPLDLYLAINFFTTTTPPSGCYLYRFGTAYDAIKHICEQFALVPRYTFGTIDELIDADPANNKHRLIFGSRGRSGTAIDMLGKFTESNVLLDTPRKSRSIHAAETFTAANSIYFENEIARSGEPPSYVKFDIIKQVDHELYNGGVFSYGYLYTLSAGEMYHTITARFWDYELGAYVDMDQPNDLGFAGTMAWYLFHRFAGGRYQYTRTYADIKASDGSTVSQRNVRTLARQAISDGITSRNFYMTEKRTNIINNTVKITWAQE